MTRVIGKPWTKEDDEIAVHLSKTGMRNDRIAELLKRTSEGVRKRLACLMPSKGESKDKAKRAIRPSQTFTGDEEAFAKAMQGLWFEDMPDIKSGTPKFKPPSTTGMYSMTGGSL